jgi:hypothetical protein
MVGIARIVVFLVMVAVFVTPFDFAVLFGNSEASHWLRSGLIAGAMSAFLSSGAWVERLLKHKPVEKPE